MEKEVIWHMIHYRRGARALSGIFTVALLILAASFSLNAAQLHVDTIAAWDRYVQTQSSQAEARGRSRPFLWSDESPDRTRRLRDGEIIVAPVGENPKPVANGLIHHWIAAIFLAHESKDDVLAVVRDYDRYQQVFAPNVVESRLLARAETGDLFRLRILNKALVARFALDAEFQSSYMSLDKERAYSITYSTSVREIEASGEGNEHELRPDTGHGFIWRLYNIARFEQRDGGVYVEMEAVALSRDVPVTLHWLVNPVVRRVSKDSLTVSLQKTQAALLETNQSASSLRTKHTPPAISNSLLP